VELQGVTQVEKNPRSDTLQDRGSHLRQSKARFNILYMLVAEKNFQYLPKLKLNSIQSCTIHVVIITSLTFEAKAKSLSEISKSKFSVFITHPNDEPHL